LPLAAAIMLAGCSTPPSNETAFAAPTQLTATLADPVDIDLAWTNHATAAAGYFVEYSPDANGQFIIITALPPNATSFRHPRLMPRTQFVYRVLPYFGLPSNTAGLTTGKSASQVVPQAPKPKKAAPDTEPNKSLRSISTFAAAAPTDLQAALDTPGGIKLDWKDHAADADGYLVEIKPGWSSDFKVSAILAPGSTNMTSYGFPLDTKFAFRVRAFFYGPPSNMASQTTGAQPPAGRAATKQGD
jgi:hypothetical protein